MRMTDEAVVQAFMLLVDAAGELDDPFHGTGPSDEHVADLAKLGDARPLRALADKANAALEARAGLADVASSVLSVIRRLAI